MVGHCDICGDVFDSHDGGAICTRCDRVFCLKCEEMKIVHLSSGETDNATCVDCLDIPDSV